ncbi:MAG: maleylpyruvate isomerase family mycothiol-dependent enzyme [Chloroflexi bacterium]|nr:maleylpyruvate isomerase family mycothiol-dependent enzyme [Chloroflexota bacterium]
MHSTTATPTRHQFHEAIRAERRSLADFVETLTQEQWSSASACSGWTIGETVNHLLVGDGGTWRAGEALLHLKSPYRWVADRQRELAERGPAVAAERLRSDRLSITARFPGRFGPRANLAENLIHVDDIRRPLGVPRPGPPDERTAFAALRTVARWQFRKLRVGGTLAISTTAGSALTVVSRFPVPRVIRGVADGADARVTGDVVDLMTFLTGRESAVNVEGDGPLADVLRRPMPTV